MMMVDPSGMYATPPPQKNLGTWDIPVTDNFTNMDRDEQIWSTAVLLSYLTNLNTVPIPATGVSGVPRPASPPSSKCYDAAIAEYQQAIQQAYNFFQDEIKDIGFVAGFDEANPGIGIELGSWAGIKGARGALKAAGVKRGATLAVEFFGVEFGIEDGVILGQVVAGATNAYRTRNDYARAKAVFDHQAQNAWSHYQHRVRTQCQ